MKLKLFFMSIFLFPILAFSQSPVKTPNDVVSKIKKQVTCDWMDETVDTFKAGNPEKELSGIAVCMFADMATLKKAVNLGCNFIITHEPVFYNHLDETAAFQNNPVFREKMNFIEKYNLVIFRFHDHIHMTQPDGISMGMINKLGLEEYAVNGSLTFFELPENSLDDYAQTLKERLGMESIRVIGNPNMKFSKVAFMAGAPGGQRQIKMLQNDNVEVLIGGEAPEWETYLYVNDAASQGKKKAVIFLGHVKSEEAGMEYCAEWLRGFIDGVPIHFIENEANFTSF